MITTKSTIEYGHDVVFEFSGGHPLQLLLLGDRLGHEHLTVLRLVLGVLQRRTVLLGRLTVLDLPLILSATACEGRLVGGDLWVL